MSWRDQINCDPIPWLLEPDDPGVRYLTLRDLLELPANDPELAQARRSAHLSGPIGKVLAKMEPEGYWVKAGAGYAPKYRSTVWAIILLAELGATCAEDERVALACDYMLEHTFTASGMFGCSGTPASTIDCLQGNLSWALLELGVAPHRLEKAFDWLARSQTGEGLAPASDRQATLRYYSYKCGPGFACGANNRLACAWGAVKVMRAFAAWPAARRTPLIERAIQQGIDFLFSVDPATAAYPSPTTGKPNSSWWKFGFPVFYVTDVLQICEALAGLGYARDPRLANALELVRQKQDAQGRWALEYDYSGKTWGTYGLKKAPNKWVTLRVLRVLKAAAD